MKALKSIGAQDQAELLQEALDLDESSPGYDDELEKLDIDFCNCYPEIETELLEIYLDKNEDHFIKFEN